MAALLADYADAQQGCAERGKHLQLGQQAASGCEHFVPGKGGGSDGAKDDLFKLWSFHFGGVFFSPRDTIPWQLGLAGGFGVALVGSQTWELGARARGSYLPRPTTDRSLSATVAPYFGVRFPLTAETALRVLGGVGIGSFWIADRGPEGRLDLDLTLHIASTTPHSRLQVGPQIRLGRSFSLLRKDAAWTLAAEVGVTL